MPLMTPVIVAAVKHGASDADRLPLRFVVLPPEFEFCAIIPLAGNTIEVAPEVNVALKFPLKGLTKVAIHFPTCVPPQPDARIE